MPSKKSSKKSRKTGRAPSRKRKTRTAASKRKSFKKLGLKNFPKTQKQLTYYETTLNGSPSVFAMPALIKANCISITNAGTNYDARQSKGIFLKGLRIRMHYANKLFRPMVVHMALVVPKFGINGITDTFQTEFFNGLGVGSSGASKEGIQFDDASQNGLLLATLPINTERWAIIRHTRFKLGVISTTGGYSSGELKNYRSLYRYVSINKQVDFPDSTSNLPRPDQQIYLLTWAAPMDWEVSQGLIDDALLIMQNVVCVFTRGNG